MAASRILIRGGRVMDPATGTDCVNDVVITDGRVTCVGPVSENFDPERVINVPGSLVCPGIIDLCARLREPGMEHKATISSEAEAAASAGITTLCCPPDTSPVIDTPAVVELIRDRSEQIGKVRVLPIGALTRGLEGEQLSEMWALKTAGCIAVSNARSPVANTLVLRRAMEYAASFDLLVVVRPEDHWLRDQGVIHEGAVAARLGLPGIPEAAETVAVARVLALTGQTGARVHFAQLSTARAAQMIARAKREGLPVSADISVHQLHLSELDLKGYDGNYHVIPPLRGIDDRNRLREYVADGTIAAICSDHQPHEEGAKLDAFASAEAGMSTLETMVPLTLRLVDSGCLQLSEAIAGLTHWPAKILGLELGTLAPGAIADVCIIDPDRQWTVDRQSWVSHGWNTPFMGQSMRGRVTHTLFAGQLVFER